MKAIFKLIFLAVIVIFGHKWLDEKGISVSEKLQPVWEWMDEQKGMLEKEFLSLENEFVNNSGEEKLISDNNYSETDNYTYNNDNSNSFAQNNSSYTSDGSSASHVSTSSYSYSNEDTEHLVHSGKKNQTRENIVPDADLDWIKDITKEYSPNTWKLLQLYEKLPNSISAKGVNGSTLSSSKSCDTYHYVKNGSAVAIIESMATNVHEIAHGYYGLNIYHYANQRNINLSWDNVDGYIYISPNEAYFASFPKEKLFPSKKLVNVIPEEMRTFRFDTYINGNTSTQNDGVIGLLDEFHAYYLGSKFKYDMRDVYKIIYTTDAKGIIEWIKQTQSSMGAFYEFNFFILEYLRFMKHNETDNYHALMENKQFLKAYRSIYEHFQKLQNDYENSIYSEMAKLNDSDEYEAHMDNGTLWVKKSGSGSSTGMDIFSNDVAILKPVLESDRYYDIKSDLHMY